MSRFRNRSELLSHGAVKARRTALDCLEAALAAVDTYQGTRRIVRLQDGQLRVGELCIDLAQTGRVFVVGAGKGAYPIARALEEILGPRIARGVVATKELPAEPLGRIRLLQAGHPVPDQRSLCAGQAIQGIAAEAREGDLVLACLTGGCSALMVLPVEGVTLEDKIGLNRLLLRTGAQIGEMNAVRKHVSRIKGGGLVQLFQPARVITFTQDTAPEALPWPDPAVPDPSTFAQAIEVLRRYEIWEETPERIRRHLERGLRDPSLETPKRFEGGQAPVFDVGNPRSACLAAVERARELGYSAHVLSTLLEGESREAGIVLAGIAKEIRRHRRPFAPPCVLASAGETTVAIRGAAGSGGPNQETVLGFAGSILRDPGVALVSIDSEGTDGPTEIAGGIADSETVPRLKAAGLTLHEVLRGHDSSTALKALGDAVITGPTYTNVVNLRVLVIEDGE